MGETPLAMRPFISICIPAYKNRASLQRLLHSIREQHFNDYEVIVCDDSCSDELDALVAAYEGLPGFRYVRNRQRLGSPANWNFCVSLAHGAWIKIMHHDDWFSAPASLSLFASEADQTAVSFLFCSCDAFKNGKEYGFTYAPFGDDKKLLKTTDLLPYELLSVNRIGCPSVTLMRRSCYQDFDPRLIWFVDVDAYIRQIGRGDVLYLSDRLVNVTYLSENQITHAVGKDLSIGLRERVYLLDKYELLARPEYADQLVVEWSPLPFSLLLGSLLFPQLPARLGTRWVMLTSLLRNRLNRVLISLGLGLRQQVDRWLERFVKRMLS
ncbi:glycosyltransferase family 2 protein [Cyanobium sp. Morenito 9A2]|uniref:glycosyltransferase family 2 protein n=1 Tax=Cyanobium sp. Morenito 9A2 TaxID=2823718 RepID=UPI0020CEA780|nr:glycosyltransferase family 2 protein [Cyanobium sp. Morenito 9A2]MCP9850235.1 glycosyltransferase family 2 protein [Cyanobium sp. Morenito 9A2]